MNRILLYGFYCLFSFSLLQCASRSDSKILAKVGSEYITENDLRYSMENKQNNRVFDPANIEQNKVDLEKHIESVVLASAAKKEKYYLDSYLNDRWSSIEKRILDGIIRQDFIETSAGIPQRELLDYYKKNQSRYTDSTGKAKPFLSVQREIADSVLIAKAKLDSAYTAKKDFYRQINGADTIYLPLDSVKNQVIANYLNDYRAQLRDNRNETLKKKYAIEYTKPKSTYSDSELTDYYEKNKQRYMGKETYRAYHLEMSSEEKLNKSIKGIKTLEAFQALAKKSSENNWTKVNGGDLGLVKKSHSFPYGIGMFPQVFTQFDSLEQIEGFKITSPLENPQTKKWHVFVLTEKLPAEVKPFARVKEQVKIDIQENSTFDVPKDYVIATYTGGKITEKDVQFLRLEIPPRYQRQYTREGLAEFLVNWNLAEIEAKEMGILEIPEVQYILKKEKLRYWARIYIDSTVSQNFGFSESELKQAFEKNKSLFLQNPEQETYTEGLKRDIAIYLNLEEKDLQLEYHTNPDAYYQDSVLLPYEKARYQVFQNIKQESYDLPFKKHIERLKASTGIEIFAPEYKPEPNPNPTKLLEKAQKSHSDRNLSEAIDSYIALRTQFASVDSIQDSVIMGLSQVYIEQERYRDAIKEYRRMLFLYPQSKNAYKAQFMIGFILSENLKEDKKAIQVFKELLAKWPKSDLSDDADWMIRNIESGGALMPTLEQ